MRTASDQFRPVTREQPCPICSKSDRCKRADDGTAICFRTPNPPPGYRFLKNGLDGSCYIHKPDGPDSLRSGNPGALDWEHEARRCTAALTAEHAADLAARLGVRADSLTAIGLGYAGADDLSRWRAGFAGDADRPAGAFTFPEKNGVTCGLALRAADGRKGAARGCKRGLVIPIAAAGAGPTIVVEGASDVAACLTLFVHAIGRPSNTGGAEHIAAIIGDGEIIIAGENDEKSDGKFPGRDGAKRVAAAVARRLKRRVAWSLPPDGAKDVRAWLGARIAAGLDINDIDACRVAGQELIHRLQASAEFSEPKRDVADMVEILKEPAEPGERRRFMRTDLGLAERIVADAGDDLRFTKGRGWLRWSGKVWAADDTGEIVRAAKQTIRRMYREAMGLTEDQAEEREELVKFALRSESASRIAAAIELVRTEAAVAVADANFDRNRMLLNVLNGTIDLETQTLRPHCRGDLITKLAPTQYDPAAKCPTFERFIGEIIPDDAVRLFIQRAFGYTLTGDVSERAIFMLLGIGSNGKSTLLGAIGHVLGDYAISSDAETFMVRHNPGGAREDLARLAGARLVSSVELPDGATFDESLLKRLSGGVDLITARFLYKGSFDYLPSFKLWFAFNHRPNLRDDSASAWDRIALVNFNRRFEEHEKDPHISDKLKSESAGILNWMLSGLRAWRASGLRFPASVRAATVEYKDAMDVLGQWVDERCAVGPHAQEALATLYSDYRTWAIDGGIKIPMTRNSFGRRLSDRGFKPLKDGAGNRLYGGVACRL